MPLSLKTMDVQIEGDQWNRRFRTVQVNRTYYIYWNGTEMLLPAGRHPYISVLKQMGDVETTGIIFNSFVTNGFLRWYITTELLSLFPSMIWSKITFKTINYNNKRKVLNTKKKYHDGYGTGLRRIRRRHEGNKAKEKKFICMFAVFSSAQPWTGHNFPCWPMSLVLLGS